MLDQLIEELERLNRIGSTRSDQSSPEDMAWFHQHPLRAHTQHPMGWGEAIPAVVAWLRDKQIDQLHGDGAAAALEAAIADGSVFGDTDGDTVHVDPHTAALHDGLAEQTFKVTDG